MYKINTTRPTTSVFIPLWANWWHIIIILCSTSNDLYCNYSVSLLNECVSSFVTMCCYCCLSCFFFFVFFHIMSYNTLFYIGRCVTNIFNEPLIQQFYFLCDGDSCFFHTCGYYEKLNICTHMIAKSIFLL